MMGNGAMIRKMVEERDDTGDNEYYHCDMYMYTCTCISYSSGNVYEGTWRNRLRHGHGTMHWKEEGERYTGDWVNGIQVGSFHQVLLLYLMIIIGW